MMPIPVRERVFKTLEAVTGITKEKLTARSRKYDRALARAVAYEYLRKCGYSTPAIGEVFCRDHATILHALKALQEWLESGDKKIRELHRLFNESMKENG